ncbi:MAG: DUF3782 domain-containing protein [Candidatus Verstraetearchaeota archaeon]|nr:DUF3782 domain-containing protein [Candidatus Verstraetearchaeota archaeon]
MAVSLDVVELKKRVIELLREDEEFRLAVAGLLNLNTILLELKKLREDFNRLVELEEKRWEENNKRWEENNKRWEEARKRFEAIEVELARLSKAVAEVEVVLGSIGRRWGRDLEKAVLEIYRHALEERGIEPGKVEKFVYVDSEGKYYKKGARVEVDVYVHDERLYLIEVKSHAEYEDVEWFHDVSKIVEKVLGREADKLILVAVHIDEEALKRARELGMDVIYGAAIP